MSRKGIRGLASPMLALGLAALAFAGCGELTGPKSPSTPTNVTATLLPGGTSVLVSWTPSPQNDGVVSYNILRNGTKVGESKTTSFTDAGLAQQQTYKYTVSANCTSGVLSDASPESAGATVFTRDITPPTITSRVPAPGATGVSASATVTVVFSEPMDSTTINSTTFNLRVTSLGAAILGTVVFTPATRTAVFTPNTVMPNPASITVTVTTGAKDLSGNGLVADVAWTFTTADQTPPTVLLTTPANGATAPPSVIFFVSFSEAMDASTINATNISLKVTSTGVKVDGNVNYNTTTHIASFTPNQTLAQNVGYTLTISGAVKDAAGNQMGNAVTVSITTLDVTPPTVVLTVPADGATGVSTTAPITAKFSEPMDISSINGTTFTVKPTSGSTSVAGIVTYDNASSTAIFTLSSSLSSTTSYTATITTGVKDVSGNAMAANKVWTFTTADIVAPTVKSVTPLNAAIDVPVTANVQVTFSEPMASASITDSTFRLKNTLTSALVPASVAYNTATNTATLTPTTGPLSNSTNYTIVVTTGVKDVAGNQLASQFNSTFTTVPVPDTTAPTIFTLSPANGATGIATNTVVTIQFNEPMNQMTINSTNIRLTDSLSAPVAGIVTYDAPTNTAKFTPTGALNNSAKYTVTVTMGVTDTSGNQLAAQSVTTFTTVADTIAPTIQSTNPTNGQNNVSVASNPVVTVTFSEAMNPTTINGTNFKLNLTTGGALVAGAVSYDTITHVAKFTPSAPGLLPNTGYTATVMGVKDAVGNLFIGSQIFSFTTVP